MEIILILISINVLAFILPYIINFGGADSHYSFLQMGWKNNQEIADGEYYRLLTSNFLHADLWHLLFNMYSLFQIGPAVSYFFQPWGFLLIYITSGISGSLFSFFFNQNPSVGASGAIFGLVGALVALAFLQNDFSLLAQLFLIIFVNAMYGFLNPQIDNFGHLGGFVGGFVLAFLLLRFAF